MTGVVPNIDQDRNRTVGRLLVGSGRRAGLPAIARPERIERPYERLGTHPDLVARLWDELGGALPEDCRYAVYGWPALVHPRSGVIFGFAQGAHTYGLRLPEALAEEAVRAGALRAIGYPDGSALEAARLGTGWILGRWLSQEPSWCQSAYDHADPPAGLGGGCREAGPD